MRIEGVETSAGEVILRTSKAGDNVALAARKQTLDGMWAANLALKNLFDALPSEAKNNLQKLTQSTLKNTLDKLQPNAELLAAVKDKPQLARLKTKHRELLDCFTQSR